jgi:hypothetical protein
MESKKFWEELNDPLSFDTIRTAQKTTRPIILLLLNVYSFTEPLRGNRVFA